MARKKIALIGAGMIGLLTAQAARAAGTLLGRPGVLRGAVAHAGISLGWGLVLARVLPRTRPVWWGTVAGGAIAGVDLGLIGRRLPELAALYVGPQLADHLAFGALCGATLWVFDRRLARPAAAAVTPPVVRN